MSWADSKLWADAYTPEIKRIIGECLIYEAPLYVDRNCNTDLIVPAASVSVHVRAHQYARLYADEVAVRDSRPYNETELSKIMAGRGTHLLYAFAAAEGPTLCAWTLGRLDVLARYYLEYIRLNGKPPGELHANKDGSSSFRTFRLADLPPDFVIARRAYTGD
jgi:hypothetical protein